MSQINRDMDVNFPIKFNQFQLWRKTQNSKIHQLKKRTISLLFSLQKSLLSLMADIEPPSFSLGLDLDFEPSQNHPPIWGLPTPKIPGAVELHQKGKEKVKELEDYDEFELRVSDSEPESPEISARSLLLRLRRGGPSFPKPISTPIFNSVDDDIEEFSDEEIARTSMVLVNFLFVN